MLIEVKNTRQWYYDDEVNDPRDAVRRFLRKAAKVQAERPGALVCPVFVARRAQQTLIRAGHETGFLVASTDAQVALVDHEMERSRASFAEVRDELGYLDMRQLRAGQTTNFHRGIASKHIPKNARAAAERWQAAHHRYL